MQERGVTDVYVVGLAYDYCVGSTAFDAAALGYKTTIVMDATRPVAEASAKVMDDRLEKAGVLKMVSVQLLGQH